MHEQSQQVLRSEGRWTRRIRHVASMARDNEAAAAFYEDVFGLRRLPTRVPGGLDGTVVDLTDGETNFSLLTPAGTALLDRSETTVGPLHIGLAVGDVRALDAGFSRYGVDGYAHSPGFCKFRDTEGVETDAIDDEKLAPRGDAPAGNWFGIRHVAYVVTDLERSLSFFEQLFGLVRLPARKPLNFEGETADLTDGHIHLVLAQPTVVDGVVPADQRHVGLLHLGLVVDSFTEQASKYAAWNVEPYDIRGDPPNFWKIRDPDGVEIDVATTPDVFPITEHEHA